jgi:uncharacterized protein
VADLKAKAMSGNSETLHEQPSDLAAETIDRHRAIASLMEEFEAVDWYQQRVDAASDDELRAVLAHNRDEELEHAAMVLEWLRRHNPVIDEMLRTYLFTKGPITDVEAAGGGEAGQGDGSLGIGDLKAETGR